MHSDLVIEKFHKSYAVDEATGCWIWTGPITGRPDTAPYDRRPWVYFDGKTRFAYRVSYEIHVGPIAPGLCACHRCDVPLCVNPDHLFLGTRGDNCRDMARKGRASRPQGERCNTAKLTDAQAAEIRRRYVRLAQNRSNARVLAAEFGIHQSTVADIVFGRTRKATHVR